MTTIVMPHSSEQLQHIKPDDDVYGTASQDLGELLSHYTPYFGPFKLNDQVFPDPESVGSSYKPLYITSSDQPITRSDAVRKSFPGLSIGNMIASGHHNDLFAGYLDIHTDTVNQYGENDPTVWLTYRESYYLTPNGNGIIGRSLVRTWDIDRPHHGFIANGTVTGNTHVGRGAAILDGWVTDSAIEDGAYVYSGTVVGSKLSGNGVKVVGSTILYSEIDGWAQLDFQTKLTGAMLRGTNDIQGHIALCDVILEDVLIRHSCGYTRSNEIVPEHTAADGVRQKLQRYGSVACMDCGDRNVPVYGNPVAYITDFDTVKQP